MPREWDEYLARMGRTSEIGSGPSAKGGPENAPEHVARPFPERARQFMPFAALNGFGELIAQVERETQRANEQR